jgi:hypothetical protein
VVERRIDDLLKRFGDARRTKVYGVNWDYPVPAKASTGMKLAIVGKDRVVRYSDPQTIHRLTSRQGINYLDQYPLLYQRNIYGWTDNGYCIVIPVFNQPPLLNPMKVNLIGFSADSDGSQVFALLSDGGSIPPTSTWRC